ncbi:MAG TPA: biotin/lipoyl-containing protein [Candidatus Acidoferrales bacterium]|nr:biotin/lipoyl-containing protein [Candidatus Acidoferrales bacterium]
MRVNVRIGNRERRVEIERRGGHLHFRLDNEDVAADAIQLRPGIYSILLGGFAYEVRVNSGTEDLLVQVNGRDYRAEVFDPRQWRRDRGELVEAEGRQQVVAPMPGKIVRVLVKTGESVETGQGLMVVEAMKMQNEIKSPKSGKIERLLVREGQAVNSGETLAVVA